MAASNVAWAVVNGLATQVAAGNTVAGAVPEFTVVIISFTNAPAAVAAGALPAEPGTCVTADCNATTLVLTAIDCTRLCK